jgi:MazG family protein
MQEPSALGRVVTLVRDLRNRCPWDAAQTPATLRPYLVEEALELDHAIATGNPELVRAELGDVMLHVAFQIVLGEEAGAFGAEDVTREIEAKMHRRHPHLFLKGQEGQEGQREQETKDRPTWERHKQRERTLDPHYSILDGLPPTLPAMIAAFRVQERAAGVGFDWPDVRGPLEKVREETGELERELAAPGPTDRVEAELGDLLFATINLARKAGVDPRAALEKATARFVDRFRGMETLAAERGIEIGYASLEELDRLWDEVKGKAAQPGSGTAAR